MPATLDTQANPSPISVTAITDPAALPHLAAEWERLLPPSHPGAVFRSGAWLVPWWNQFSDGKALRVLVARRGHAMVGALPCYRARGPLGLSVLRLLGDNVVCSDHMGVIARAADADEVAAAFADAILAGEEDVALSGLLPDEPLLVAFERAGGARGLAPLRTTVAPAPFLDVAAAGSWKDYLASLPNGAGAQLSRRRRWLEKQPGFALRVVTAEGEIDGALDDLFRLHAARWADEGGSAGIPDERVRRFHREAARNLAREGIARVYLLEVEGAVRAAFYGFERGGRFAFYQSGNEPAWKARSVGTVVLGAALEDAFRRGLTEFDFLRGEERYKDTFASGRRELVRVSASPRARARAVRGLERAARRAARALLGEAAKKRVKAALGMGRAAASEGASR